MCYCYLHIFPNEKIYVGTTQQKKVEMRWKKGGSGLAHKGIPRTKSKWLTPSGEIREMNISHVKQHHPDWILIQNQE